MQVYIKNFIPLTRRCFSEVAFKVKMIEDEFTTEEYEVQAEEGSTLLKACKQSNIPIHSFCGGNCKCGTCIVKVSSKLDEALGAKSDKQSTRLDAVGKNEPQYRLACQTKIIPAFNGETIVIDYFNEYSLCSTNNLNYISLNHLQLIDYFTSMFTEFKILF